MSGGGGLLNYGFMIFFAHTYIAGRGSTASVLYFHTFTRTYGQVADFEYSINELGIVLYIWNF